MENALQVDVYISPPIPATTGSGDPTKQWWSPISCTLIQGPTSAVLVDTPISIRQTEELAAWIKKTAPGKELKYIYTTYAHGDHFFGNPVILQHFPGTTSIATSLVATGIKTTLATAIPRWEEWFPNGQILTKGQIVPESLPENGEFSIDGHSLFGVNVAHSDTSASSFLGDAGTHFVHSPPLRYENHHPVREDPLSNFPPEVQGEMDGRWYDIRDLEGFLQEQGVHLFTSPPTESGRVSSNVAAVNVSALIKGKIPEFE